MNKLQFFPVCNFLADTWTCWAIFRFYDAYMFY